MKYLYKRYIVQYKHHMLWEIDEQKPKWSLWKDEYADVDTLEEALEAIERFKESDEYEGLSSVKYRVIFRHDKVVYPKRK